MTEHTELEWHELNVGFPFDPCESALHSRTEVAWLHQHDDHKFSLLARFAAIMNHHRSMGVGILQATAKLVTGLPGYKTVMKARPVALNFF